MKLMKVQYIARKIQNSKFDVSIRTELSEFSSHLPCQESGLMHKDGTFYKKHIRRQ